MRTSWAGCGLVSLMALSLPVEAEAPASDAARPQVQFVPREGQPQSLTLDAATLSQLQKLMPSSDAAPKAQTLRLDCPALVRIREQMKSPRSPSWTSADAARSDTKAQEAPTRSQDHEHQLKKTREWLAGLEQRFGCGRGQ